MNPPAWLELDEFWAAGEPVEGTELGEGEGVEAFV